MRKYLLILILAVVSVPTVANARRSSNTHESLKEAQEQSQSDYNQRQRLQQQQETNNLLMRQEQREITRQNKERREEFQEKLKDDFYGLGKDYYRLGER